MSWQAALFAVFASGVIFIFITIFKLREKKLSMPFQRNLSMLLGRGLDYLLRLLV